MFKHSLLAVMLVGISFSSFGGLVAGLNYHYLSDDLSGEDVGFSIIGASAGYKHSIEKNFYIVPELRLGLGIGDDSINYQGINVDLEVEHFIALSIRGQYEHPKGIYLFAAPSYTNVEVKASAQQATLTDDEWEFGLGAGIGYHFTESTSVEFSFENYDGTDVLSLGVRFNLPTKQKF